MAPSENPGSKADAVLLLVQEMLIDAFGIVIPGFCFISLAALAVGLPLIDVAHQFGPLQHLIGIRQFVSANSAFVFAIGSVFAFVAGHILYRQDVKLPDKLSIRWRWKTLKNSGMVRSQCEECVQFPYSHLKEYLLDRNLVDLANFVQWSGADFPASDCKGEPLPPKQENSKTKLRSKHLISRLKLRIKMKDSRLFFDILRNEAHIRLASSVWYASTILCLVFAPVGVALGMFANLYPAGARWQHVEAIIVPSGILMLSLLVSWSIVLSLHYQRVREIVYVLETAHILGVPPDTLKSEGDAVTRDVQGPAD